MLSLKKLQLACDHASSPQVAEARLNIEAQGAKPAPAPTVPGKGPA